MAEGDVPQAWIDLFDHLEGSCEGLTGAMASFDLDEGLQLDAAFCAYQDSRLMPCETCGWWAEPHEIDEDGNCEQCHEGDDE